MADPHEPAPHRPVGADPATPDEAPAASPRARRRDTTAERRARPRRQPDRPGADGRGQSPARSDGPASGQDGSADGTSAPRLRRTGRRTAITRRRRRDLQLRTILGALLGIVVVAGVVLIASLGFDRARDLVASPEEAAAPSVFAPGDRQPALAVVTYDEASGDAAAAAVAVLAYDRDEDQGTILLVPGGTVADVPGHGSFTIGDAYTFGEGPLVAVTVDNLLDVRLDGVVSVSREGWARLADALGPVEVEVRSRLVAEEAEGGGEVRFEPGRQRLDGDRLAEYLTFRAQGETELEALPRVQQVLAGLLDRIAEDPSALRGALGLDEQPADGDVAAGGTDTAAGDPDTAEPSAPTGPLQTADPELAYALLTELAEAGQRQQVTTLTLPVSPLGTGRDDLYRVDASRAEQLIEERLAASRPTEAAGAGRSLQVLNGNGTPGIGQQVAERLQPGGYRILLTGNADRFSHETTRIVIHDDSSEQLAIARDIRERLGAGEIERSGTPQSVVDVTIVVGADFPPE
jgi:polyisoprenyl-teichoic acid--peptidoglycan teichoic acid transferase